MSGCGKESGAVLSIDEYNILLLFLSAVILFLKRKYVEKIFFKCSVFLKKSHKNGLSTRKDI